MGIVVTILLAVLIALILLVPVVLCFPLFYSLRLSRGEVTTAVASISWSGIAVGRYELGKGLELKVLGFRKSLSDASLRGDRKPRRSSYNTPKKRRKKKSYSLNLRVLLSIARDILNHVKPQRLHGQLRIGFEDPYHTGLLGALLYATPVSMGQVIITPVYEDEVLEGWFQAEGRVIPIVLVAIALRRFAPVILGNIRSKFRSNERKVEKHA